MAVSVYIPTYLSISEFKRTYQIINTFIPSVTTNDNFYVILVSFMFSDKLLHYDNEIDVLITKYVINNSTFGVCSRIYIAILCFWKYVLSFKQMSPLKAPRGKKMSIQSSSFTLALLFNISVIIFSVT